MRLDVYLAENGFADSRERAKRLILSGAVTLNGKKADKPSAEVDGDVDVQVVQARFVGRGGYKLEAALENFFVDPAGCTALDIGASTGGFTDCLLQHGAAHVTAIDAGCGQLHPKLRADSRVCNIEKYNARELSAADLGRFDLAVMDVSFISQTLILPRIPDVLLPGGKLLSLIKPQFEAGRTALNKNGIVRRDADRTFAIRRVLEAARAVGLSPCGLAPSPIPGGDGNTEYLACFAVNGEDTVSPDIIEKIVKGGIPQ